MKVKNNNNFLKLIIALCVFIAGFYILEKNSDKWSVPLSASELNPQTVKALGMLQSPVLIEIFSSKKSQVSRKIIEFLGAFQNQSNQIKLQLTDPESNPQKVRQFAITMIGEMLFHYQDKTVHVTELSEEAVINAILALQNDSEDWIVLAEGYGMMSVEDDSSAGLYELLLYLKKLGYKVARMRLDPSLVLPETVKVIILPRPVETIDESMAVWLNEQSIQNKSLIWLSDTDSLGAQPHLELILDVFMGDKIVLENDEASGVVSAETSHDITENFNQPIFISEAHEVVTNGGKAFIKNFNEKAIAVSFQKNNSSTIVFGDSDWISNQYFHVASNKNLVVRLIDFALQRHQRLNLALEVKKGTELHLSQFELLFLAILGLVVIPMMFAVIAFIQWRKQRVQR